jgi:hypothetical protein
MNLPFPAPNMLQCRKSKWRTPALDSSAMQRSPALPRAVKISTSMPKRFLVLLLDLPFQFRAGRDRYRHLAFFPRDVGSGLGYADC